MSAYKNVSIGMLARKHSFATVERCYGKVQQFSREGLTAMIAAISPLKEDEATFEQCKTLLSKLYFELSRVNGEQSEIWTGKMTEDLLQHALVVAPWKMPKQHALRAVAIASMMHTSGYAGVTSADCAKRLSMLRDWMDNLSNCTEMCPGIDMEEHDHRCKLLLRTICANYDKADAQRAARQKVWCLQPTWCNVCA